MASMQIERQVYVNMRNNTSDEMTFERFHNFTDDISIGFFRSIPAGDIEYQTGVVSKGAVVYSGRNKEQVPSAWVLAWDTPSSDAILPVRKVYVTCGPKSEILEKMTAGEILKNLTKASEFSVFKDEVTKTTADAVVIGAAPIDSASVSANFGLIINN